MFKVVAGSIAQFLRRYANFVGAGAFVLALLPSIYFCRGYLDPEAPTYLVHQLRPIPLLKNIFDITANDYGIFRARELSYLFNIVDAYFIQWSFLAGFGHYLSFVFYLSVFGIVVSHVWLSQKQWPHRTLQPWLIVLLYVTSSVVAMSGHYFRTSKILVSVCAFAVSWIFWMAYHAKGSWNPTKIGHWSRPLLVAFLLLAGGLLDEQGVLVAGLFLVLFVLASFFQRSLHLLAYAAGSLAALGVYFFYRWYLGPRLIVRITGQPLMEDPSGSLFRSDDLARVFQLTGAGLKILLFWLGSFFGGDWQVGLVFAAALVGAGVLIWRSRQDKARGFVTCSLLVCGLVFVLANALMVGRHEKMAERFVYGVYYGLPFVTLLVPLTQFLVTIPALQEVFVQRLVNAVLAGGVIANLVGLPVAFEMRRQGYKDFIGYEYTALGDGVRACAAGKPFNQSRYTDDIVLCSVLRKARLNISRR